MVKHLILPLLVLAVGTVSGQSITSCTVRELNQMIDENKEEVLVINFWATFCKPCVAEIPHFIKVCDSKANLKVRLVLVSVDTKDMFPKRLHSFARKHHYKATLKWLNETDANYFCPAISREWSGSIPATMIVNGRNGKRSFFESELSEADLTAAISEISE